ncbi:DUF2871 domain-containing protein [Corynebacterium hindlerae]|uniref:DUF2871 domain-containing protein n=1 Tax=Corynebacterium hindlerae TaxID=699041 RepID=A0A7G5FGY2_9CORY|nr:DUF2871 domain-containing protein [Corynebacterium hindlerae]QMV85873.1 DUF2871 domain-containing protein [Corynebacterium hindlerae]
MNKLFVAAASFATLGLISGVFYREFTRASDFVGQTQLSTLHTHYLVLGMMFFLLLMALNAVFNLEDHKLFPPFFYTYVVGLLWMTTMMVVKGIWQVQNPGGEYSAALSGVSGLSHITMAAAIFMLFRIVAKQSKQFKRAV